MAGILWLTLTALCLLLLVEMFSMAPCWLLPLPVLLLASPLWFALREAFLFQRRLLLSGATREGCFTRRVLWGGSLGSALQVIPALVFSLLLLALGARLTALEWTLLFADAGVLAVLNHLYQRRFRSQVHPAMVGVFVRRWPLALSNFALLTLTFFLVSFYLVGAPDLRALSWQQAAEQAFAAQRQALTCSWAGWLVGSGREKDRWRPGGGDDGYRPLCAYRSGRATVRHRRRWRHLAAGRQGGHRGRRDPLAGNAARRDPQRPGGGKTSSNPRPAAATPGYGRTPRRRGAGQPRRSLHPRPGWAVRLAGIRGGHGRQ